MKFYQNSNGLWVLGDVIIPAGTCIIETINDDVAISYINGRNVIYNGPVTELLKENEDGYADLAELFNACGDFFVKAVADGGSVDVINTSASGTTSIQLLFGKAINHTNILVSTDIITLSLEETTDTKIKEYIYIFETGVTAPVINLPEESKDIIFIQALKRYFISFVRVSSDNVFTFYKEEAI